MKADKFTKIILTVIAVNLTVLTIQNFDLIPKAYAGDESAPQFNEVNYGLVPLNEDGNIEVKLSDYDEIDVNIVGIDTWDELEVKLVEIETNDELDINIDEIGGRFVPFNGTLPVQVVD